jgi:hypothetical protein
MKRLIPLLIIILIFIAGYYFDYLSSKNSQPIQFDDLIHVLGTDSHIETYLDSIGFKYLESKDEWDRETWVYNYDPNTDRAEIFCYVNYNDDTNEVFFVFSLESGYNVMFRDIKKKCLYVETKEWVSVYFHYPTNVHFLCGYEPIQGMGGIRYIIYN